MFTAYGTGKMGDQMYDSDDEFNSYLELPNESQSFAQHTTDVEYKLELDDDEQEDDIDWADDDADVSWAMGSTADAGDVSSGYAEDTFSFRFINALLGLPRPFV